MTENPQWWLLGLVAVAFFVATIAAVIRGCQRELVVPFRDKAGELHLACIRCHRLQLNGIWTEKTVETCIQEARCAS